MAEPMLTPEEETELVFGIPPGYRPQARWRCRTCGSDMSEGEVERRRAQKLAEKIEAARLRALTPGKLLAACWRDLRDGKR